MGTHEFSTRPGTVIHEQFERRAAERSEAVAIRSGEDEVTYGELNRRANKLARHLQRLGVGPEDLVALYLDRSPAMVIAILGVLKAGGAYVPLDMAYPRERLRYMIDDAAPRVIVTDRNLSSQLPERAGRVVCLDSDGDAIDAESAENLEATAEESNAAYVIYTSGSTGAPKGVVVTHKNVVRLFASTDHWFRFSTEDVWTLFHSFAFDFSVWELWGALFYGGKVVIVPHLVSRSPDAFHKLLAREKVTVLNQTPSAFRQLIRADESSGGRELALRWVILGGEALDLGTLKPWFDRIGDHTPQIVNMYGITETTVHVTFRPIRIEDVTSGRGSVIGGPIPDLSLHILDERKEPCAVGVAGELYIGGAGVAREYLRRPALTAERFITGRFGGGSTERLYRSGDLARRSPDGDVEYLGRIDQQVKIRGFRIELGEIEAALNAHPAIRESVVAVHKDEAGDTRLTAYIAGGQDCPGIEELRSFLKRKLPEYMTPAQFVFLERLPLTVNGKIDRRALPPPGRQRPDLRTEFVAPESGAERVLAEIWESVLAITPIGTRDNFFALGGDSIRSIQVLAKAQERGLRLSLAQLFEHPTIGELARCGGLQEPGEPELRRASIAPFGCLAPGDRARLPAGLEDAYPMTKLQIGMVYHSGRDPASAIFHDVFSFRFRMEWDEAKLREAIGRLTERHSIYRTSFDLGGRGEPLQLIHKSVIVPFTIEDLRGRSDDDQKFALVEWIEREKGRPFDWTRPPFLRLHAQRYRDDTFQLIVSFHHAIMDGWSLAVMLTELFQEYSALMAGSSARIEPPPVSYRDFVLLEAEALNSEETRSFWREKLAQPVIHRLPRWPASLREHRREQVRGPEVMIGREVLRGLKQLAHSAGTPLRTVLLAAHCRVMSVLAGHDDVLTGLVANGRPQISGGERLIGLFLNTLPFRLQLNGGSWHELVRQTFLAERELIERRRFPLSEIQQITGGQPLFETVFDFVQFHVYRGLPGYQERSFLEDHYFEANDFTFYQTFMLDADGAELQMHCDYDPNELCAPQIRAMGDYYVHTLEAMARSPEARYEAHSPLPAEERQRLVRDWNQTERPFPHEACVHELIEAQAARTPEAIAIIGDSGRLTYGALVGQANQLAARLTELGAVPGWLIGIYAPRSPEMLVSLLAVLKAGAAYVPLDPSYPIERLEFMIEDAGVNLILAGATALELRDAAQTKVVRLEDLLSDDDGAPTRPAPSSAPALAQQPGERRGSAEQAAYVIFTSGSTGKPKGVEITHRAVVNFLTSMQREPGFGSDDVILAVTTLSFDIAALELFLPLISGGRVVIASHDTTLDPEALAATLEASGITVMQATPTTWRMLLQSGWNGNPALKALCGGEPLSRGLANDLVARCAEVWNMYGPTETTVWSCIQKFTREDGPVSIGRPIANTQVYLLDAQRNLTPTGAQGEIYIGGEGLARGYLNRPELTADRFVRCSLDPGTGTSARLYRTGDLGRYLPDGQILCEGRTDDQVKIRGVRVELGEVEHALTTHPAIAAAAVAAEEDPAGGKRLVAYYIAHPGSGVRADEIRRFIESKLPERIAPAILIELTEFPLTPNGKVDRSRLPKGASAPTDEHRGYAAPRTPLEQYVADIWKEVLGVERIGLEDNFFTLGGHSLLVIRAIGRLRNELEADISVRSLFENPSLEGFTLELMQKMIERDGSNADLPGADSATDSARPDTASVAQ